MMQYNIKGQNWGTVIVFHDVTPDCVCVCMCVCVCAHTQNHWAMEFIKELSRQGQTEKSAHKQTLMSAIRQFHYR